MRRMATTRHFFTKSSDFPPNCGFFFRKGMKSERYILFVFPLSLMLARSALFILVALLLASTPLFAADDVNSPGLRVFCQKLLNIDANASNDSASNGTVASLPNVTLGAKNNETLARLGAANDSVARMREAGLPYLRANDLLEIAQQWYDGQTAIELSGTTPDYTFSLQKVSEILAIEQNSFAVDDDLKALLVRMQGADKDANLLSANSLMAQAAQEFRDGRIEEAKTLINQAYDDVSNAESEAVHSRTMVESTRKNIETFLEENWRPILAAVLGVLVFSFVFQKQIRRFLLNAKLRSVMREREVIASMLRTLQKDYFEKKTMSELTYHVKTKKYSDIARNINRQVPLLKEELKKV
jgi:hypothetical protein